MSDVLACLRGWRATVGDVPALVVREACLRRWRGWRANVSYVVGVLAWVTCQRG